MNIIVLGATSQIGSAIAVAFARGNRLLLVGRNRAKLQEAAGRCREEGAEGVIEVASDLRHGCGDILRAVVDRPVDLIINSSSATSRLRDNEIPAASFADCVMVDLLAPLELIGNVLISQGERPLGIVFVSTILTLVKSPNRAIYSGLKRIHELCLRSLQSSHGGLSLLIVKIAKVIPANEKSLATEKLAKAIRRAFDIRKGTIVYGWAGRFMVALYYFHPLIFNLVVQARRILSPRIRAPRPEV